MSETNETRTIKHARALGYLTDRCTYYNAFSGRTSDLFGLFDVLAIGHGEVVGIQATSKGHRSDHLAKIARSAATYRWLREGGCTQIELWLWSRPKHRWELKRERLTANQLQVIRDRVLEQEEGIGTS